MGVTRGAKMESPVCQRGGYREGGARAVSQKRAKLTKFGYTYPLKPIAVSKNQAEYASESGYSGSTYKKLSDTGSWENDSSMTSSVLSAVGFSLGGGLAF